MKKVKILLSLFLVVSLGNFVFFTKNVQAEDELKTAIYVHGKMEYQRNGLISFSSQESPVINISGSNLKESEISVDVYKAEMSDFLKFLTYDEKNQQINNKVSLQNKEKIGSFKTKWEDSFELPNKDNGVFLIHAYTKTTEVFTFAIRSNTGAVVKEGRDKLIVWTQNLETKRKLPSQNVVFYNLKQGVSKLNSAVTNNEGIAETTLSDRYDVAVQQETEKI